MKKLHSFADKNLLQHAQLLERMTASARSRLPQYLAEHCWVGGYDATSVALITDDAVFTTPINYQQHEILTQLNEEFGAELQRRFRKATVRASRFPVPGAEK